MQTKYVRMLTSFKNHNEGETYEIDNETATKWIEAELCEPTNDPSDGLYEKLAAAVETKITTAVEKITEAVKVKTQPIPVVARDDSDKSVADFVSLFVKGKRQELENKYGDMPRALDLDEGRYSRKVLSDSGDSALIPTPLAAELLYSTGFDDSVLSKVRRVPMPGDTYKYPVLAQSGITPSNGSSSYFGGIYLAYGVEDSDASATGEPAFANLSLVSNKLTALAQITLEAQQDSVIPLQEVLTQQFGKAYNNFADANILAGDGSGKPTGVINHAATASVSRKTANQVNYIDVVNMIGKQASASGNWFWVFSNTAYPQLLNMQSAGGFLVYLANARDAAGKTLLGMPVLRSEHASVLGSAGDVVLMNGDQYIWGERMGITVSFSDHVQFVKGRRVVKLEARNDGKPVHTGTITLADGTTQVAEAIQLDDPAS